MTRKRLYLISAVGRSAYVCLNMLLKSIVIEWIKIVSPQKLTALDPIKSNQIKPNHSSRTTRTKGGYVTDSLLFWHPLSKPLLTTSPRFGLWQVKYNKGNWWVCSNAKMLWRLHVSLDFPLPSAPLPSLFYTDLIYRLSTLDCVKAQLLPNLQYQHIFSISYSKILTIFVDSFLQANTPSLTQLWYFLYRWQSSSELL